MPESLGHQLGDLNSPSAPAPPVPVGCVGGDIGGVWTLRLCCLQQSSSRGTGWQRSSVAMVLTGAQMREGVNTKAAFNS